MIDSLGQACIRPCRIEKEHGNRTPDGPHLTPDDELRKWEGLNDGQV